MKKDPLAAASPADVSLLPAPFWQSNLERATPIMDALLKLTFLLALFAIPLSYYSNLRTRITSFEEETSALVVKQASLSKYLQEFEPSNRKTESLLTQPVERTLNGGAQRWTQTLQGIAHASGPEVELLDIRALGQPDGAGLREVRIDGIISAIEPYQAKATFRKMLEVSLKPAFHPHAVEATYERLDEDLTAGKTAFTLVASAGKRSFAAGKGSAP